MKIFLDHLDKRTKYLKTKLKKYETYEAVFNNYIKANDGDFFIFPPNKKWGEEEIKQLPNNIVLFCGKVDNFCLKILEEKNIKYINFLNDEKFAIENAKLTAEGILALIIENSPRSLFENNILLLGGGRITKAFSMLLTKLNIQFCIASFQESGCLESQFFCKKTYFAYKFLTDIKNFDVIINTRPFEFLQENDIKKIRKNTLFIETASKNCLDETKAKNFLYLKAPALPQRFCFESAANLLLEKILGEIKWKT